MKKAELKLSPELQKQEDELITKYGKGKVHRITVEGKTAWFQKPDRPLVSYAMTLIATDPLGAYEAVLRATYIGGDMILIDDDDHFFAAGPEVNKMIGNKVAQLVKL